MKKTYSFRLQWPFITRKKKIRPGPGGLYQTADADLASWIRKAQGVTEITDDQANRILGIAAKGTRQTGAPPAPAPAPTPPPAAPVATPVIEGAPAGEPEVFTTTTSDTTAATVEVDVTDPATEKTAANDSGGSIGDEADDDSESLVTEGLTADALGAMTNTELRETLESLDVNVPARAVKADLVGLVLANVDGKPAA